MDAHRPASPGLEEYRQIHLAENNPGRPPDVATALTYVKSGEILDHYEN